MGRCISSSRATTNTATRAQELSFKALMYDGNLPEAYTAMGLSYFIWGKLEEASASSRKAIELDPGRFHRALDARPDPFLDSGDFEQAYALFQRVIELKPSVLLRPTRTSHRPATGWGARKKRVSRAAQVLQLLPNYLLQNPDDARATDVLRGRLAEINRKDEALREGYQGSGAEPRTIP